MKIFNVVPHLPEELQPLKEIAYNMWHAWDPEALTLFFRIDRDLWNACNHNPVLMLGRIDQERMNELAADESFRMHLERVYGEFRRYMEDRDFYQLHLDLPADMKVAYFSAEFGVNDSIPNYSGGLGVLAGDHVKSASDLNIPLVGIGLMYQQGYFHQYLTTDGWQQETYPENDFHNMPLTLVRDEKGEPITITVPIADRQVHARAWQLSVGRVNCYLLDTNNLLNGPGDRKITDQLYGGDLEHRLQQEMILGIGGVRMLHAMGVRPDVFHMNEGHSAFVSLERIHLLMGEGLSRQAATTFVRSTNVFTTHTPVPAGNDVFPSEMIRHWMSGYTGETGWAMADILALGRKDPRDQKEGLCMTVLALNHASGANGVSSLHGEVSRNMWKGLYPTVETSEVPIDHITNGVHIQSWISIEMAALYNRYLGSRWTTDPDNETTWSRVFNIPDEELWRTHERRRERLVAFARKRLLKSLKARGSRQQEMDLAREVLDPEALTIGFARRFATYKRGDLLFRDPDRLSALLNNPDRPVQLIIAGKAHPRDMAGKDIIKRIYQFTRDPRFSKRVVFLEDYDINVARYLVQGVDVWLNNPRRPLEASGTSGMKAAANGALNMSILDGWWCEAFNGDNGWTIGGGEEYQDHEYQDEVESRAILDLLENEVIPTFFKRTSDDLPREWIGRVKNSLSTVCSFFNSHRMVAEYMDDFYQYAGMHARQLSADNFKELNAVEAWKGHIAAHWDRVSIVESGFDGTHENPLGQALAVHVVADLAGLSPADVCVQAYYGKLTADGRFAYVDTLELNHGTPADGGRFRFGGELDLDRTGKFGLRFRIQPRHGLLDPVQTLHQLKWD